MPSLEALDRRLGTVRTTWGTETLVTKLVDHSDFQFTQDHTRTPYRQEKHIVSTELKDGAITSDITISGRCTYDGAWLDFLYGVAQWEEGGTPSNPTEQTGGEGDYLHEQTLTGGNSAIGAEHTLAWPIDSNSWMSFNSWRANSITISGTVNQPLEYSVSGITTAYTLSGINDLTVLNGLPRQDYEEMIMTGAGAHFRRSAGFVDPLDGADNIPILSFSYTLSRPGETRQYALDGNNTSVPQLPRFLGRYEQSLTITLPDNSNDNYGYWNAFKNSTVSQASITVTGSQIGSGVNRSFKINFPHLWHTGPIGPGAGITEETLAEPVLEFVPSTRSEGPPNGMNLADTHVVFVNTQSTGYSN